MWNSGLTTSERGDWKTPAKLYARLIAERFDVSDTHNGTFDALKDPWPSPWYCNPPYGRGISEWTKLMRLSPGLALLPARTDTKWFHEDVLPYARIEWIRGRLHFDDLGPAPFPSMLCYFKE